MARERRAGFADIAAATPLPTSAVFLGKLSGLATLTGIILAAAWANT